MSEADLLKAVLELARIFRWKSAHFRPAKTEHGWRTAVSGDGKGFFDLVLVRPPRVLFVELKSEKGKMALEQDDWFAMACGCPGVETYCWRPRDLDGDKPLIVEKLR